MCNRILSNFTPLNCVFKGYLKMWRNTCETLSEKSSMQTNVRMFLILLRNQYANK